MMALEKESPEGETLGNQETRTDEQPTGTVSHAVVESNGHGKAKRTGANDHHGFCFDLLPQTLKDLSQWGVWRREYTDGRPKNVPYDAKTASNLSVADPGTTWSPYDVALAAYQRGTRGQWDGLSIVLKEGGGLVALDLDECVDENGDLTLEAREIVTLWGSYLEYSPSRRGLRGFAFGALPEGRRKVGKLEIYDTGKALTVTGWHLSCSPTTLETRPDAIREIHKKFFTKPKRQPAKGINPDEYETLSDDEVLDLATRAKNGARVQALIDGDFTGYASPSEADLAACNYLAFYCGPDSHEQIDRIFREHFAGFRPNKWNGRHYGNGDTYGRRTIQVALEGRSEFYKPKRVKPATKAGTGGDEAAIADLARAEMDGTTGAFRLTDLGNGERFVKKHGHDFLYCNAWRKWMAFDGTRWKKDDAQTVRKRGRDTVRGMYTEAGHLVDRMSEAADPLEKARLLKQQTQLLRHAVQSENTKRVSAMIDLAQMDLPVMPDDFDTDLWLLTVANGTLDLRTGALRPHARGDLITKYIPVAYDPTATCPQWVAFLASVMRDDDAAIDFLQKAVGYSLTGDTREDCLFLMHGHGANGKSTFTSVLKELLGDYGKTAEFSTFLRQDKATVRNDLADLQGTRLVVAGETEEGKRLSMPVVKALTGRDAVKARFLFSEFFEYAPRMKIWLAANHKPVIKGTDHGIWRRIRLVPFLQPYGDLKAGPLFVAGVPVLQKDDGMTRKLLEELPGILAWAVRGCRAWQTDGLPLPTLIQEATAKYRAESDEIGGFLDECCTLEPGATAFSSALYEEYAHWCRRGGEEPRTKKSFGMLLQERGCEPNKGTAGVRLWEGVKIAYSPT